MCKNGHNFLQSFYQSRPLDYFSLVITRIEKTRSQAVARIADRTAKNCRGHVT